MNIWMSAGINNFQ